MSLPFSKPSFRPILRTVAWKLAPQVMGDRAHRHQMRLQDSWGHHAIACDLVAAHGDRVLAGPFVGMRYPPVRPHSVPKRLGTYEQELHQWLSDALASQPRRFIDIGASDGYYAIGVALKGVPVDAFEMSRSARRELHELATLNNVAVKVHGLATSARLRRLDLEHAFVLSDCEGDELSIFDMNTVKKVHTATIIIEVHEYVRPGAVQALQQRLATSHTCSYIAPMRHRSADPSVLALLPADRHDVALTDLRSGDTPWLMFRPRLAD